MRGTPWNRLPQTATGSSGPVPPPLLRFLPRPGRPYRPAARGGRPGSGGRRTRPRGRRATRRAGVRRHLDLTHLPGARWEHPQPGRPHDVAARQEDSGRTRAKYGRCGCPSARLLPAESVTRARRMMSVPALHVAAQAQESIPACGSVVADQNSVTLPSRIWLTFATGISTGLLPREADSTHRYSAA